MQPPAVLAIHGGAGPAPADEADGGAARWPGQAAGLAAALRAGLAVLAGGGPALDAVIAAVAVLEDDEHWNAGRGSALTAAGTVEMDAAVADGQGRRIGGVACVTGVRHPMLAARAVMDDGRHVLLSGPGAEAFAREAGLAFEPADWFITDAAAGRWIDVERRRRGTVGAVARDAAGHLAAATSTGGRNGQLPGRIGDSPIPGAGTWADDASCAVSATGIGEAFLRAAFAHEVDARLRLEGVDLDTACQEALAAVDGGRRGRWLHRRRPGGPARPALHDGPDAPGLGRSGRAAVGGLPARPAGAHRIGANRPNTALRVPPRQGCKSPYHGSVAMRTNCKFYESRTYPTGESVRKCDLDLAPEAPFRCPDNMPGLQAPHGRHRLELRNPPERPGPAAAQGLRRVGRRPPRRGGEHRERRRARDPGRVRKQEERRPGLAGWLDRIKRRR